jgi:glycerophosphoryl diester phosphodiesterase
MVLLMAHRGGEGRWPSNTLFAFQKALEHHSDVLELVSTARQMVS